MIEKKSGLFIPVCDCCGLELPEEYDFKDAVNAMKLEHWTFVSPTEGCTNWEHYCPHCARLSRRVVFPDGSTGKRN